MLPSITTLIRICLLVARPQDLPASREFFYLCVAAAFAILFMGYSILAGTGNPLLLAAINTALLGVIWLVILQVAGRTDRWIQSASAIYGSAAILNLISLPIITSGLDIPSMDKEGISETSRLVIIGLWAWEVAVTARITRETLEINLPLAVILSVAMSFVLQMAMVTMFGSTS